MTYYTCEHTLEAMLSFIYDAWCSKKGHQNIELLLEPIDQYTLFDEYIHVDADMRKVEKVIDAVCRKISPTFYRELVYTYMAYEKHTLDNIYRCMILGFAYGANALKMMQYRVLHHCGFRVVMWDVVTRDYSRRLTAEDVLNNVRRYTRPGSIITFHDSLKSIDKLNHALPEALQWLIQEGYEFKVFD